MRIMDKLRSCTFSFLLPILIVNTGVLAASPPTTLPTSNTAHQPTSPSPSSDVLAAYPSTPSLQPSKFSSQPKSVPLSLLSSGLSSSVTPVLSTIVDATSTVISTAVKRPDKPSYVSSFSRFENAETSTTAFSTSPILSRSGKVEPSSNGLLVTSWPFSRKSHSTESSSNEIAQTSAVVSTAVAKPSKTNSAELSTSSKTKAKSSSTFTSLKESSVKTPTSIETGETSFLKFTSSPILRQSRSVSPTSSTKTDEKKPSTTTPSAHLDESSSVPIGVTDSVKFTSSPTPLPSSDEIPSSKPLTTTYLVGLGDSSSEEYSQPDSTEISPVSSPTLRKSTGERSSWSIEITKSSAIAPEESLVESSSVLFYLPSEGTPTGAVTVTTSPTQLQSSKLASPSRTTFVVTATSSSTSQKSVSAVLTSGTKIANIKSLISTISISLKESSSVPSYSQPESTATRLDTLTSSPTSEKSSRVTLTSRSRTADFKSSTTTPSASLEQSSSVPSYSQPESTGLDIVTSSPASGKSGSVTSTSKAKIFDINSSAITSSASQGDSSSLPYFSPADSTTTSAASFTSSPTSLQSSSATISSITKIDYIKSSTKTPSTSLEESSSVPSYSLPESTTTSTASFTSSLTSLQYRSVTPSSMTKIDYIKSSTKTPSESLKESSSVPSYLLPESTTTSTASFTSSPTPLQSLSVTLSSKTKIDYIKSSMETPSASIEESSSAPSYSLPESTTASEASFTSSPTSLQSRSITPSSMTKIDYIKSSIKTRSASLEEFSSVASYSPTASTTTRATSSPTSPQSSSVTQTSRTKTAYIKSSITTPSASQGELGSLPPYSHPDSTQTSPVSSTSSSMSRQSTSSMLPLKTKIVDTKSSTIITSASIGESSSVLSYLKAGSTPISSVSYTSSPTSPQYSSVPPSSRTETTDTTSFTIRPSESLGETSSVAIYSHPQSAPTSVVTTTPSLTSLQPRSLPPSSRTRTSDTKSSTISPSDRLGESSSSPSFSLPQAAPTRLLNFTSSPTPQQYSSVTPSSSDQIPLPPLNKTTLQRPATIAKTSVTSFPTLFPTKSKISSVSSSAEIGTTGFVTLPSSQDPIQYTITTRSLSTDVTKITSETFSSSPRPRRPSSIPPSSSSIIAARQSLTKSPSPSVEVNTTRTATSTSRSTYIPVVASSSTMNVTVKQVDLTMNKTITGSRSSINFEVSFSSVKLTHDVTVTSQLHSAVQATLSSSKRTTRLFNFTSTEMVMTPSTVSPFSAAKSSDSVNFTSSQRPFISETSSIGSFRPTESSMTFRKDQTTLRPTLSTIAFPSISTANSTDRSIYLSTTRTSIDMGPTSVSTTSATSFKTQTEPSPSQSSEITPTTTISPTTQKPEVSLKRFNVTMTITNRDYNSSLGDKESQEFQNLAEEVRDNVKNALNDSKGFISSEVEKFLEANSVTCKLKILVREDSDITKETIKVSLENSSGSLKLTDVTVVDAEMPTTMAVTDKKTPTKPTEKTRTSIDMSPSKKESLSLSTVHATLSLSSQILPLFSAQNFTKDQTAKIPSPSTSVRPTVTTVKATLSFVSLPSTSTSTALSLSSLPSKTSVSGDLSSTVPSPLSSEVVSTASLTLQKTSQYVSARVPSRTGVSMSSAMISIPSLIQTRSAIVTSVDVKTTSVSTESSTSSTSQRQSSSFSPSSSIKSTSSQSFSLLTTQTVSSTKQEVTVPSSNSTEITLPSFSSPVSSVSSPITVIETARSVASVSSPPSGQWSSMKPSLSTGIASIRSETSSKAKTSQILRLSARASRSFSMDMDVTSSSLLSRTAPISKSPQPTSVSTTSATSFKTQTEPSPSQSSGVTSTTTISTTEKTTTKKPTKDDVVFQVTAAIQNKEYTDELGNVSSKEFKSLSKDVAEVLTKIFDGRLPGFLSVEVVRFQRGSIICTFNLRTKRESTVSEKEIKELLSYERSKYTFKDIKVQRKTTGPTETPTTKITEKGAVFRVTLTIANDVYTEELADKNSEQFKKLSKELTNILTDIFKKVPGFLRVEIISFRKGSVICVFNVITEESKVSGDEIKGVLTEASKNGKAGKYTFKDVNVEQPQTGKATKPEENNWPAWATAIIAVFGVLLLVIFIIIYVIYKRLTSGSADLPNHDKEDMPLKDVNPGSPTIHHRNSEPTERTSFLSESRMEE